MSDTENAGPEVTIACIQFEPVIGQTDSNLERIVALVREAHAQGALVVVLPELSDSGYVFESREELDGCAGGIPDGVASQCLIALAKDLGIYIVAGLAEKDGDALYNSAIFCGPQGYIGKYRKLHLWNREKLFFRPGDMGAPVFETPIGIVGLAICYDGWFPEIFRKMALEGADLVCVPTNWVPMAGNEGHPEAMANILHKAAAHSNSLFIACADRIGVERGQPFVGQSLIVGPTGWPVAGPASPANPEIIVATVRLSEARSHRKINEFNDVFGDRRPDVYGSTDPSREPQFEK